MKRSIKSIFNNLSIYLISVLIVAFVAMILTFEQRLSFQKVDNLNEQKRLLSELMKLPEDEVDLALIALNAKSTQLTLNIQKLQSMQNYNFTDNFIFHNTQEYETDLANLMALVLNFNKAANEHYLTQENDEKLLFEYEQNLHKAYEETTAFIDKLVFKNITYDQKKFDVAELSMIVTFILALIATFWYKNRLLHIYKDLEYLFQIEKSKMDYTIFSIEADAIALRMNRKSLTTDNPSMIDPITGINNHKGMLSSYSQKKDLKTSNFTSVAVLEIDNFSKTKRSFSQELTQAILKKVAYTISLHEQPIDVIARSDYNQFTLIFSRTSKEQCYKDTDLVRQSIAELKFNLPNQESSAITVSGGFIIKPHNTTLEEAMKQAKEILAYAQKTTTNKVLQMRDIAEKDLS